MTPDQRKQALDEIAAEVAVCTLCPLHKGRTKSVPGDGHSETEVVFVGEGPGYNEDREGLPFVGQAGGLLNELLKAIGWRREEVYITNVVKCRPPGNRDPEPSEIAACAPYLKRQLEIVDPAVIVTLGRHSLQTFMPGARISAVHGTTQPTDADTGATNSTTYAMYHPAAALRQGSLKETMLTDMAGLPDVLLASRERRRSDAPEPPAVAIAAAASETAAVPVEQGAPEQVAEVALEPAVAVAPPSEIAAPVEIGPTVEVAPVEIATPVDVAAAPVTEVAPASVESQPEPRPDDLDSALETAAVVSTAPSSTEPQLELFG